jgi:hypothetical protein
MIEASRANAVRQTRSRATLETITRERALCERVLAYLTTANCWQTADEIAAGTTIKRKTIQNGLGGMVRETPPPVATRGTVVKSAPRQYHTLAPHFDGLRGDHAQEMIPPDPPPYRGSAGGNHFRGANGEAGNDRWTK